MNEIQTWPHHSWKVSDDKWTPMMTPASLYRQVLVGNSNPVCTAPYYTGNIQQNATAGSFITRVSATDPNGGNITYSIPDTSLQRFTVNPTSGDIYTSTNLTRRFRSTLEFTVRASNAAGLYCDSVVRVNILTTPSAQTIVTVYNGSAAAIGANSAPVFSQSSYSCTTSNCNSGGTICTVTAGGAVSYSIIGSSTSNNPFTVSNNGAISFSGSGNVASGTNTTMTLQATNANGNSASTTLSIATSCNYYGNYNSGSSGTSSAGSYCGCNGDMNCLLSTIYNPGYCGGGALIGSGIGGIGGVGGIPGAAQQVGIVTTTAPQFGQSQYTLTAPACGAGSIIGQVTANNYPQSYTIEGNNNFAITNAGAISLNYAMVPGTQSFVVSAINPAGTAYTLVTVTLTCTGGSGAVITSAPVAPVVPGAPVLPGAVAAPVAVGGTTFNNNGVNVPLGSSGPGAPKFSQSTYSLRIINCGVGSLVGTVPCQSCDTYAIVNAGATASGYGITPKGKITVTQTPTYGATQTLLIQAFNGLGSAFASVSIYADCQGSFPYPVGTNIPPIALPGAGIPGVPVAAPPPVPVAVPAPAPVPAAVPANSGFSTTSYTFSLNNCDPGATVGTVSASGGATYAITGGGAGFTINPSSGVITTNGQVTRGTQAFLVQAQTAGGNSFATVTVSATCGGGGGGGGGSGGFSQPSYTFFPTACSPGVIVGTVYARGTNVQYTSNGLPYWSVDPQSGVISSVTSVPNYSTFVVTAQSGSGGTSTVTVTTSSNCPDYFAYNVAACAPNTVVVPASAISGILASGINSFTLSGPNSALFNFNQQNGQIISTGQLQSGTYAYVLTASLSAGGTYTAFITLIVNCNAATVTFTQPAYNFMVGCSVLPQRVGVVTASSSNGDTMNYGLGAVSRLFFIDPSSGEIRTQTGLRRTGKHAFTVSALAASGATGIATVTVIVAGDCRY
ncbi:uncharacterized protein LOC129588924 [Paramacrobiotus metropolitanus]|uniref:uncharacterized protein LOC129588924 n=1 Tax=Paramacrobiotus metropolitanus TaxID=2943436 RepID=UPI0024459717|nr:uncharacterized protein LOC129588924 [Paramacrobiotus metropolitanus]